MLNVLNGFVEAHDRYIALERVRTECENPQQRELMHIELLRAYLEVQYRARQIAGIQYADGNDYVDQN
jgi:hypothetical protein